MPDCPTCGRHLNRVHRNPLEKLVYADAYTCSKCHRRYRVHSARVNAFFDFTFSLHTHCIRCGTPRVHRQLKRDRVDSVSKRPYSMLCRMTGAPRYKCDSCRLQYYDWRSPVPEPRA